MEAFGGDQISDRATKIYTAEGMLRQKRYCCDTAELTSKRGRTIHECNHEGGRKGCLPDTIHRRPAL